MPYIEAERRKVFDDQLEHIAAHLHHPGELNYAITYLIRAFRADNHGPSYALFNDTMGALIGCLLEDYVTQIHPYERGKRTLNGDVRFRGSGSESGPGDVAKPGEW